ncbi:MAG: CybP [Candidatus Gallionella acididurans]|uniref:CybP n=1 Tax=Candidatus Gallionella acididurans TaxID=1796491 RepID=A0A139BVD3_9PROT|nr:MAG: CybP [Candidatus Gallionella acididurans]
MVRRILVWDVPTRVFHWLQALSFGVAYLTAFSERMRNYHVALGYILLGLIVFRLLWGFVGTRYARFRSFLFNPKEIFSYLLTMVKGRPAHYPGHNPAGSVSVWLLLALGLFICVTGVLALQDDASDLVVELHGLATNVMLGVIALHLVGVLMSSLLHRENLVRSMFSGLKSAESEKGIHHHYGWLGVLMVIAVVVFWFAYVKHPLG